MRKSFLIIALVLLAANIYCQKNFQLKSPDGKLDIYVSLNNKIKYSLSYEKCEMIKSSPISLQLEDGKGVGLGSVLLNTKTTKNDRIIKANFYKRNEIRDSYNELILNFKEDFSVVFRAYNEGMAYRFISTGKKDFKLKNEEVTFNFGKDYKAYIPYVKANAETIENQYFNSFENTYTYTSLSEMNPKRLVFMPLVVEMDGGRKLCITESDLESYPGMYLRNDNNSTTLKSNFAAYPATTVQGGYNKLQQTVTDREPFIAKCKAKSKLPWRIIIVTNNDKDLTESDMVYKLASPSRIEDLSWIKPGKVAWEWWNNWGLSHVDFETGVNNKTYMAYIDFASRNNIKYVILDEGWSVKMQTDLFQVVAEIDLEKLIAHGKSKNVDLILWAGYYAFERDMEKVCKHYSEMGIKGFKVDFMDRDDQQMVGFYYKAAETAAKYKLLLDFHGAYKPTGLNRTYPNVINFEGVHGQEQMKWSDIKTDQVTYDVTMPFIRMVAGPVDYTQGAMRNSTKKTFRPINNEPMSQGTRCHQLAEYVVFDSPLNMLCDSPTNYEKEQECTDFISAIPTVWDNTISLNGEIGKYITMARQKNDSWYLGALTNWEPRELKINLSFLGEGNWKAEVFKDGINANNIASDYQKEIIDIPADKNLTVSMAPGGGCAMKIYKK